MVSGNVFRSIRLTAVTALTSRHLPRLFTFRPTCLPPEPNSYHTKKYIETRTLHQYATSPVDLFTLVRTGYLNHTHIHSITHDNTSLLHPTLTPTSSHLSLFFTCFHLKHTHTILPVGLINIASVPLTTHTHTCPSPPRLTCCPARQRLQCCSLITRHPTCYLPAATCLPMGLDEKFRLLRAHLAADDTYLQEGEMLRGRAKVIVFPDVIYLLGLRLCLYGCNIFMYYFLLDTD